MSNQPRIHPNTVEPFEDRIDFLFRELELSIKWQRPSILFAVYSSEYVHSGAEADLDYKLVKIDQKVIRVAIDNKDNADVIGKLAELSSVQNAIFFINGLRWGGIAGTDLYHDLNNQREFYVYRTLRFHSSFNCNSLALAPDSRARNSVSRRLNFIDSSSMGK